MVRRISSTVAQNNFGRLLDEVAQKKMPYIIERRGTAVAVILSLSELEALITDAQRGDAIVQLLREQQATYQLGSQIEAAEETEEAP